MKLGFIDLTALNQLERRALIGLGVLVAILTLGAVASWSELIDTTLGAVALTVLTIAIISVAALGVTVTLLLAKNRDLIETSGAESHAALHDPLTGAANRRHFEQVLDDLVSEANPKHALLMLDLDRFKPVNDLYGHAAGDALLKEISAGLAKLVSPRDRVARLGGDEFAILLNTTDDQLSKAVSVNALSIGICH